MRSKKVILVEVKRQMHNNNSHITAIRVCCLIIGLLLVGSCTRKEEQTYVIGFSQCTGGDTWRQTMHQEMERELLFHPQLQLQIKDAEGSNERQIQHIEEFVNEGVDLLIVSPNEAKPVTPAVERAFKQDIPVIVLDRHISSESYSTFIAGNNLEIGNMAGRYIAAMGPSKVIEIWGLAGSTPAMERHSGFRKVIDQHEEIEVIKEIYGAWTEQKVLELLPAVLEEHPEATVIYAHNDYMAKAAARICREQGISEKVKIIGVDGLLDLGVAMVEKGDIQATFLYPTGGEEAIKMASVILRGKNYLRENIIGTTVIDSSNVHIMKIQMQEILNQQKDIERQKKLINSQIVTADNQRMIMYGLLSLLVISIVLGSLVLYQLKLKQRINKALIHKNEEIVRQRNEIQRMAQKANVATKAKLRFFTNMSHEFRTPLTLILGPTDELLSSDNISDSQKSGIQLIKKNAYRLLRLVNQLMDFRKIESNKMNIHLQTGNLVAFIRDLFTDFKSIADKRGIGFHYYHDVSELVCAFDQNLLDKVLFNLLSNSFKFTKEGGKIIVGLQKEDNEVRLYVEDDGQGMTPEQTVHAFDRFYQAESYSNVGSGLGLALSKEIVELHSGTIEVKSEKGGGTRFDICLPIRNIEREEDKNTNLENDVWEPNSNWSAYEETPEDEGIQEQVRDQNHDHSILIIEDDEDITSLLVSSLSKEYGVITADEGFRGLQMAYENVPDVILCDVLLPGQNGIQITRILKNDQRTSHIPVLMVTALGTIEQEVEGVQAGADAYITKPFSMVLVKEKIKNLLTARQLLKEKYAIGLSEYVEIKTDNVQDRRFINHFISFIEENLNSPDLNVQVISQEMGLSRVQLYRKIKALMGISVSDYIKKVRLNQAKRLITEEGLSLAEVAYKIGYTSPSYFSTAFKQFFGESPSEYKRKQLRPK